MRILIIGASGLVGSHIVAEALARGHTVLGTYRSYVVPTAIQLDLANESETKKVLESFRPDWVVHAAGWTWVDGCEKNPERAFKENYEQPVNLADACNKRCIKLAYLSSSYVFDGTAGPYLETDRPNPINVYAKAKWKAELTIQEIMRGAALIPRIICVWGFENQKKNFVYQVLRARKEKRRIVLPLDQIGNPTWAGDIAWWLLNLIQDDESGVWNLAGDKDNCTRAEWFGEILKGFGLGSGEVDVALELTQAINQCAKRPLHSGLNISKISNLYGRKVRSPSNFSGLPEFLA
jgi:dTDP-4-dehydrorhamnose reductase